MPDGRAAGPVLPWRLAALEARRCTGSGLVALALVALLVRAGPSPPATLVDGADAATQVGLARESAWTAAALLLACVLAARAARTPNEWRARDGLWLAPKPVSRFVLLTAAGAGLALFAAAWLALCTALIEVHLEGGDARAPRFAGGHELTRPFRLEPLGTGSWILADPGPLESPAHLRIALSTTYGGEPITDAELRVERGGDVRSARGRIDGRTRLSAEVPGGAGDVHVMLRNAGGGPMVLMDSASFELWHGGFSPRALSPWIALRLVGWVTGLALVALALGTFLSPPTAFAGALCCAAVPALAPGTPSWVPGARLGRALAFVGEGRAPAPLEPGAWIGLALLACLALALARACFRWRNA